MPISSSQLISRDVATARLVVLQRSIASTLLLVEVCKSGRRVRGLGVGRWAHSSSLRGLGEVELEACSGACDFVERTW